MSMKPVGTKNSQVSQETSLRPIVYEAWVCQEEHSNEPSKQHLANSERDVSRPHGACSRWIKQLDASSDCDFARPPSREDAPLQPLR